MIKSLIIVGTGAVASEITSCIEDSAYGCDKGIIIKGYICDNDSYMNKYKYSKPFLGSVDIYQPVDGDVFLLAIGDNNYRKQKAELLITKGANFINFIHPSCIVDKNITIGVGNIIYPFSMIGSNVKLGNFNQLTSYSYVSHDCEIGDFNFFANAGLCGHVKVGNENNFNSKATVIPRICIGNRNTIQAGMIVDKNIKDDTTVFYRYKEKVIAIPKPD